MKRVRLLGLALLAVFALGVIAAATASATEAGILPLEKTFKAAPILKGTGGASTFTVLPSGSVIPCEKVKVEATLGAAGETHINLGVGTLDVEGCKIIKGESKIACNSPGDAAEVVLLKVDIHLLNVLKEKELEPGIGIKLLENLKLTCGLLKIEIKGTAIGLVLDPEGLLVKDTEKIELHFFTGGEKCDPEPAADFKLCLAWQLDTLLGKIGAGFEVAHEVTLIPLATTNEMFLVDD
jgi:hypothetical protein